MKRRQLAKSVLATFLVAQFSGSPAWAGVEPTPFRTGLFGVAAGQAIRVSVVNAGGIINPCVTPPLLVPAVRIRDVSGKPVFESKGGLLQEEERFTGVRKSRGADLCTLWRIADADEAAAGHNFQCCINPGCAAGFASTRPR